MFGLNRKKNQPTPPAHPVEEIRSPMRGRLLPLDQVPDPVFARGLMGPGFAVDPADGRVTAPVDGTVVTIPPSRHAVGLRTPGGVDVLIHVGIDTVTLNGDGFEVHCAEGDAVEAGALLLEADLALLRSAVPSVITPVIITNAAELAVSAADLTADVGAPVLTVGRP